MNNQQSKEHSRLFDMMLDVLKEWREQGHVETCGCHLCYVVSNASKISEDANNMLAQVNSMPFMHAAKAQVKGLFDLEYNIGAAPDRKPLPQRKDTWDYSNLISAEKIRQVDEDLEAAARAYAFHDKESVFQLASDQDCPRLDSFKAGAEWQKTKEIADAEKDYLDMRRFQGEVIRLTHEINALNEKLAKVREKTIREICVYLRSEKPLPMKLYEAQFWAYHLESKFLPKESK